MEGGFVYRVSMRWSFVFLIAGCLCAKSGLQAQSVEPVLLQAELIKANDDVMRLEDDAALGGEYVMQNKAYEPLLVIPSEHFPEATAAVWIRLRGLPIQAKILYPDRQEEMEWNWSYPSEWGWIRLANLSREQVAEGLLVIRADTAQEGAGIDAVTIATDLDWDPNMSTESKYHGTAVGKTEVKP